MIVNQQSLRGIYVGFNTLFNKAFEEVAPLYTCLLYTSDAADE
mgnify:CR=1 FL=1